MQKSFGLLSPCSCLYAEWQFQCVPVPNRTVQVSSDSCAGIAGVGRWETGNFQQFDCPARIGLLLHLCQQQGRSKSCDLDGQFKYGFILCDDPKVLWFCCVTYLKGTYILHLKCSKYFWFQIPKKRGLLLTGLNQLKPSMTINCFPLGCTVWYLTIAATHGVHHWYSGVGSLPCVMTEVWNHIRGFPTSTVHPEMFPYWQDVWGCLCSPLASIYLQKTFDQTYYLKKSPSFSTHFNDS